MTDFIRLLCPFRSLIVLPTPNQFGQTSFRRHWILDNRISTGDLLRDGSVGRVPLLQALSNYCGWERNSSLSKLRSVGTVVTWKFSPLHALSIWYVYKTQDTWRPMHWIHKISYFSSILSAFLIHNVTINTSWQLNLSPCFLLQR